ncbi:MAG TPA: hypothetical protein VG651_02770 [Stellaceae bacterium]|nr:hypothetical protein [Stellaceae bacterium]
MEIGAQQLTNSFLQATDKLERLGYLFGVLTPPPLPAPRSTHMLASGLEHLAEDAPPARVFWTWLGFDYASIDIDGSPGSIPLDLNYDAAPAGHRARYDLVTNFGTTEHVANQLNAFAVIHDLTRHGGVIIHELPVHGSFNHGLINYNFKFFWLLARSNHYRFIDSVLSMDGDYYNLPTNIADFLSEFGSDPGTLRSADAGLRLVMRKEYDIPFIPPIDVETGVKTEHQMLKDRYWTVFDPERQPLP